MSTDVWVELWHGGQCRALYRGWREFIESVDPVVLDAPCRVFLNPFEDSLTVMCVVYQ